MLACLLLWIVCKRVFELFCCLQAYVTQQDDLIGTLTVQETIHYSANLRLPDHMPKAEKRAIIESTIVDMRLQDCANTPIWELASSGTLWWWKETCQYCFGDSDSPSYAVFGWTHKWSWQVCLDSRVSIISFLATISFFASHPHIFSASCTTCMRNSLSSFHHCSRPKKAFL
jgi:hypothetical protein